MARKTTAALLAELLVLFPDNNTELITPAALRTSLTNIIESFTDAYGIMTGLGDVILALTATNVRFGAFSVVDRQSPEVTPSAAVDTVTVNYTGYYEFDFTTTCTGPNNAVTRYVLRVNGIESIWATQMVNSGTGFTSEINLVGLLNLNAGDVLDVGVSSPSGSQNPTFSNSSIIVHDIQQ